MGELAALISAMVWAATSVLMTSLTAKTSPIVLSGLRLTIGTLALVVLLLVTGQFTSYSDGTRLGIAGVVGSGFVGYAFGDTLYIRALGLLGLQKAFPISMALYIGMTVVGGIVILGEPFSWGLPLGALLIGAGIMLIVVPGASRRTEELVVLPPGEIPPSALDLQLSPAVEPGTARLGYAILLLVGVFWAAATLWLAGAHGRLKPIAVGAIRAPAGGIALLAFGLVTRPDAVRAPFSNRNTLLGIAVAGLLGTGLGSLMYVYAVTEAGAARTAVLSATAPLMGLPLSILFLGERLTTRVLAGTVLCVVGILAVTA